jgi:hypothetical protein
MTNKPSWHVLASRVQAQNPSWSWSKCCAAVSAKRRKLAPKPTVAEFTAKLEQMRLF